MGIVEYVSFRLSAQNYAKEFGWEGEFVKYSDDEIPYRQRVAELREQTEGPVNPQKLVVEDRTIYTSMVKEKALELGADLVGVCEVDQDYVYSNLSAPEKYAICFAIHMEFSEIAKAPHRDVSVEAYRIYEEIAKTSVKLAEYIREQGYTARAQVVGRYDILLVPHALAAGIGEQTRIGILSSAEYGPCIRLCAVLTDAPLEIDTPIDFGVAEKCDDCEICLKSCPGKAIPEKRTMTRGVEKWTLDPVGCMRWVYYNQRGCTICLKVCPLCKVILPDQI